jgi:hypothetical protein
MSSTGIASKNSGWRETKSLHLWLCKITEFKVVEVDFERGMRFCNRFLQKFLFMIKRLMCDVQLLLCE